jgi:hypothetical protein
LIAASTASSETRSTSIVSLSIGIAGSVYAGKDSVGVIYEDEDRLVRASEAFTERCEQADEERSSLKPGR